MVATLLAVLLSSPAAPGAPLVATWDLEDDDGGFTTDEVVPVWGWGTPTVGPDTVPSGTHLWGTALDGNYVSNNDAALVLPPLNIEGLTRPVLRYSQWLALRPGDRATLQAWSGSEWVTLEPVYGYPDDGDGFSSTAGDWEQVWVDLTGLPDTSDLRLMLSTDAAGVSEGWYVDDFVLHDGDIVPPRIEDVSAPESWDDMGAGPTIQATVFDDVGLATLHVVWTSVDQADQRTTMSSLGGDRWQAELPPMAPGQDLWWHIEASDGANVATWPPDGDQVTSIHLPAPTDLQTAEGRLWGLTVPLQWTPPESTEPVVGYAVFRDGERLVETTEPAVDAPAEGPVDTFTVRGIFDTPQGVLEGDDSDPLVVDVAVPVIDAISPSSAWQGDRLRVRITGTDLLLQGDEEHAPILDLGSDVAVEEVAVDTVDAASFLIQLDDAATTGPRDVVLETGGLRLTLAEGFTVLDGAGRPSLLAVSPDSLEQGARSVLRLSTNTAFSSPPSVDLGEGVVVEEVWADASELWVSVAVANDAEVGPRRIEVDDGTRILVDDSLFRVRTRAVSTGGCSSAPGPPAPAGWVLGLLAHGWFRRRRLTAAGGSGRGDGTSPSPPTGPGCPTGCCGRTPSAGG
ncbi:MAG: hypothetical protein D6798_17815 [Deltaproteobacteria bacterium]|nr:MAG: hypothetical protein D6798_17815 [Deltaproteobacteria bacterium]